MIVADDQSGRDLHAGGLQYATSGHHLQQLHRCATCGGCFDLLSLFGVGRLIVGVDVCACAQLMLMFGGVVVCVVGQVLF